MQQNTQRGFRWLPTMSLRMHTRHVVNGVESRTAATTHTGRGGRIRRASSGRATVASIMRGGNQSCSDIQPLVVAADHQDSGRNQDHELNYHSISRSAAAVMVVIWRTHHRPATPTGVCRQHTNRHNPILHGSKLRFQLPPTQLFASVAVHPDAGACALSPVMVVRAHHHQAADVWMK